jgi:hypothetical protein
VGYAPTSEHEIFDRADYGGAIYADKSTAEFNNVEFKNNQTTTNGNHGAAIYATDSNIKISGCVFDGNGIEDKNNNVYAAHSVIYAEDSQLHIIGSTFINNGAKKDDVSKIKYSSLIVLDDSVLQMEKGEDGTKNKFSNNNSYFLINDIDSSEICVWDTDFLNNASSVLYGDNRTASDSYFSGCKFSNNVSGKFVSFYDVNTTLTFNDCDMGDSTYGEKKYFKFVENGVEKRAAVGSVFGEGSLAMIVAFVSLIASVAAIVINVSSKKQNTLTATANETAGDEE